MESFDLLGDGSTGVMKTYIIRSIQWWYIPKPYCSGSEAPVLIQPQRRGAKRLCSSKCATPSHPRDNAGKTTHKVLHV